jgi:bacillolysin
MRNGPAVWAQFGDGDGTDYSALTSLDVVGHEFTHGLTDFTADLRYRDESGAPE